ncbi:FG-GAP repeat-containing protein [Myxococcus stipitatus DSM 14675]|uniref:FG-GAP repeat-containing protein n=1 Tax=Myxococcus stipitatus (strain DSM 14675 / JCM 12634 / Mx s8) TaxID=1278073 RepID=L7U0R4_MYXSD|nr:FG-GAP-like repeat-containing protein [Myxococcus stipitatus]AGC41445.1 FG-GAP repeat-containing protein [Myxococcus stipitatus DSM 14675]
MRSFWRTLAVASVLCVGCSDDEPGPPAKPEVLLSQTPLWQVKADPSRTNECFGGSVALADFNGDGRKDLVVGTEPCSRLMRGTPHPGRVSVFVGQESYFSTQEVSALMSWPSTHPRASGTALTVVAGDVNGDRYADLLVRSRYGASVFLGQENLEAMLAEPSFRVPGADRFQLWGGHFVDLNGDGRDDLIISRSNEQRFYLSTPGAAEGPFTLVRTRPGFLSATPVGDLNGDGADDVLLPTEDGQRGYFLGCKTGAAFACDGPISATPWRLEPLGRGGLSLADMNGDGHPEAFVSTERGPLQLHLSQSDGTLSASPIWSTMGDPTFPLLGTGAWSVGDLDGDGQRQDFVMGALGRLYFFSPDAGVSQDLEPVWSWPEENTIPNGYDVYRRYAVAVPGDLNGDGIDDLIVANTASGDSLEQPVGDVAIYSGGKVPPTRREPPYMPAPRACGLALDPVNGKPDLTVDADVLKRTVHVMWRTFGADTCEVQEQCVGAAGRRKLLRFSTSILNLGTKAAALPPIGENPDMYVMDECHGHYHLNNFAAYELRDASGNTVLSGRKQGFYLVDFQSYCTDASPADYTFDPMGISPGWADIYTLDTPCQWVDVTDLPDGDYTFQVSVDTRDIVDEGTVHPNTVGFPVRLEGDTVTVLP